MAEIWQYQVRLDLAAPYAEAARAATPGGALQALTEILARHGASLKCQYDAFAEYVAAAEQGERADYPLTDWTRRTIEDPAKKARYLTSFTIYVAGEQVYDKALADALERELRPLVGGGIVTRLMVYDTNPANNPQPPAR